MKKSFKYYTFFQSSFYASMIMEISLILIIYFFFPNTPYIDVLLISAQFTTIPFNCLFVIYLHYADIMPYLYLSFKLILLEVLMFWGAYFASCSIVDSIKISQINYFYGNCLISPDFRDIRDALSHICIITTFFCIVNKLNSNYWSERKKKYDQLFHEFDKEEVQLMQNDLHISIIIPSLILMIPIVIFIIDAIL